MVYDILNGVIGGAKVDSEPVVFVANGQIVPENLKIVERIAPGSGYR